MIAIIPDFLEKAVTELLDEIDESLPREMSEEDRENNRHSFYLYYDSFGELPTVEDMLKLYYNNKKVCGNCGHFGFEHKNNFCPNIMGNGYSSICKFRLEEEKMGQ
ncbi:MAG: hypothetical protein M0R17_05925 [Candidatus Omnitrophica bacterium]|jgi:hypothetical protein|nr:hypothetical protein [Candidatus Omnitrophota bacterium]